MKSSSSQSNSIQTATGTTTATTSNNNSNPSHQAQSGPDNESNTTTTNANINTNNQIIDKRRSYIPNDYDALNSSSNDICELAKSSTNMKPLTTTLMPHDKNALNYLINEYLLDYAYKMTSVTFSEENETQDLEDWDVVGLNRAKPPKLYQLYKLYLNKNNLDELGNKKKVEPVTPLVITADAETQTKVVDLTSVEVNTTIVTFREFESVVNFDREIFDTQHTQIDKLLEKQGTLLKSLAKLESEIGGLNAERESYLRKIDYL
jgi:hypothetical protein